MTEATKTTWSAAEQKGEPGHCFSAQVFDENGVSIATLDARSDVEAVNSNARLMAASPRLAAVLREAIVWDGYDEEGVPAVWLGEAEAFLASIDGQDDPTLV